MKPPRHKLGSSCLGVSVLALLAAQFLVQAPHAGALPVNYVFHISVDGLRPDAITALGPADLPNFYRLRTEGAFTDNARSDYDYTVTLPNHTCQLTGRGVVGPSGHNWTSNTDPDPGETLASNKGSYVAGAFEVAHDHGLRTAEFAGKSKFVLFATSWDAVNGALDETGPDNGRNKIDVYVNTNDTLVLVNTLIAETTAQPFNYAFLHLKDPDTIGHDAGWDITPGSDYSNTIKVMDSLLGLIFGLIDSHPQFAGRTAIVLTADHGGSGYDHATASLPADYTVPFYVWGPGVMSGADLYALNLETRLNPGAGRPTYSDPIQPIRNGEAANVALKLLGLGPVPGSTMDYAQDLAVTVPPPDDFRLTLVDDDVVLTFSTVSNVHYDVQAKSGLKKSIWRNRAADLIGTGGMMTNIDTGAAVYSQRFYRLKLHF